LKVTFKHAGENLASSRYRAVIPQAGLARLGIEQGNDIVVVGKHGWKWEDATRGYKRVVMDICDDHFHSKHEEHYRDCCRWADAVTCNSRVMAHIIHEETGGMRG
jgi:hypothetical protein